MLKVHDLSKAYGTRVLFDGVTFAMTPGERLGLVGRNGSGKTTLLQLILDQEPPDTGRIERPKHYTVGHLSQLLAFEHDTILEEACTDLPIQEGGWVEQYRAEEALMGLGFATADFERPPQELSGGFQVRLQLAKVLVSDPNLLLLDEPTNYLDIVSMRWLRRYLRAWPGEVILITHDRGFMDSVTTHSMAIHRGKFRRVPGSTAKLYDMLAKEEEIHEKTRLNEAKSRRDDERFVDRFRYKASKARQVQSRIKMLEKKGSLDKLADIANLSFKFNAAPFHAHRLLQAEGVSFGYGDGANLIEDLTLAIEKGERVAVIGKNGKGKTTLLNLLAQELSPRSGSLKAHPALHVAHFGQTNIDRLHANQTVEEEVMSALPATDRGAARGICGLMMFSGDDALKKIKVLSGGERARVLLGKLLVSPANLVLLDEPTNHLDMESVDSLIEALVAFPGGALIVTHNERVLHALATRLVIFDRGRTTVFEGTYRDFLDRVGWSDEEAAGSGGAAAKSAPKGGKSKKQLRRMRSDVLAERSKALRPLQKKVAALENAIVKLEGELEEINQLLCQASESSAADEIARHGKRVADLQKKVDARFGELEQASSAHDRSAATFDARLEELGK